MCLYRGNYSCRCLTVDEDVCYHRREWEMLEEGQKRVRWGALAKFLEGAVGWSGWCPAHAPLPCSKGPAQPSRGPFPRSLSICFPEKKKKWGMVRIQLPQCPCPHPQIICILQGLVVMSAVARQKGVWERLSEMSWGTSYCGTCN